MTMGQRDGDGTAARIRRAQVENLYVEAMVLADEAHSAFAAQRDLGAAADDALLRVGLACESLKTTTRLMHAIAWLLHHRAMIAGDPGASPDDSAARIGEPVTADWAICRNFAAPLPRIVAASERLCERIAAIEAGWRTPPAPPPVRAMLAQLQARL